MRIAVAIVILVISVLLFAGYPAAFKQFVAGERLAGPLVVLLMPFVGLYGSVAVLRNWRFGHLCCIAFLVIAAGFVGAPALTNPDAYPIGIAVFLLLSAGFMSYDWWRPLTMPPSGGTNG